MQLRALRWSGGQLGSMRIQVFLLEKLDIPGNTAAALATVAGASCAGRGASAGKLGVRWRPGEGPENRRAAGERINLLLIGVGVELVLHALMQERVPEIKGLVI